VDRELALLVILFACLRLAAVLFLGSGGNVYQGDSDLQFYRSVGELSLGGYYPLLDYWMEYPPLFPWLVVGIYQLSLLLPAWPNNLLWFQVMLSTVLAIFDVGNVILVSGLAKLLHGRRAAVRAAWMYALLFIPLFALLSWFDTIPLFFLLLTVWLALRGRGGTSGAVAGLGLMVKIIPILAVPAAFLGFQQFRARLRFTTALAIAVGAVVAPFLWLNPTMLVASVRFIASRDSWETIWALLEGYFGTGRVPPLAARFDPQMATWELHPSTLPWSAITGVFLLLCLLLYTRHLDWQKPAVAIPAVALTVNLFLLFSKGYSPQFLVYPLALLVVLLPDVRGAAVAVLLTANNLVEWPFAFGLTSDDRLAWLVVGNRTFLLVWLSVEYAGLLVARPEGIWAWLRTRLRWIVGAAATLAVAVGILIVLGHYVTPNRPDDAVAVANYLTSFAGPDQAAIASSRDAFYQVRPRVAIGDWVLAESDAGEWPTSLDDRVSTLRQGRSRVWLIVDQSGKNSADAGKLVQSMDAWGSRATDVWFGRFHLLGYVASTPSDQAPSVHLHDVFGGVLGLQGYDLSTRDLAPGGGLTLALDFETEAPVGKDYKVFVHLVDANGQIITQSDRPLSHAGRASSKWSVGETDREGYDLLAPADAACGDFTLEAGLYDPATGQRLEITSGADVGHDTVVLAQPRACPNQGQPTPRS